MSNIKTVVVTGASGFLGSVIVDQLLDAGYTVRGTVRSGKAQRVEDAYASFGDRFSVAIIDDLATADFTEAFKGADALIHAASPLAGSASAEVVIKTAVDGTIRVLEYAHKAGIKKIVATASVISLNHPAESKSGKTFTENDWNTQTLEEALQPDYPPFLVYGASKKLAEEALWNYAKEHPELDVATIHPSFLYGLAGRGQVIDVPADGTNGFIYALISGAKGRPLAPQTMPPGYTHVADAAAAHVLALKASKSDKPKRIVSVGGYFTWKEAVEYLYGTRPALRDRLPIILQGYEASVEGWNRYDVSSSERIIGFSKFKDWKTTLDETIDDILSREKRLGVSQ
ncbi:hypothetical protein EWM64_g2911 [Hericium alpestre]|uniref:NAD-dependent epimerase/dehydratase domain-containing protein n=1 Tax=Hericium alpestre TaxID=135208 RepID=A0A4Z0A3T2_9AGAM|nr:hypothetical protein EWM64_g2911 [Hericium alpestre]